MKITANGTDAIDFVANIEKVLLGVAARYAPERIVLIQIDNWFGPRWLGFSGKSIGALGLWKNTLTVPPFVPNRVILSAHSWLPLMMKLNSPTASIDVWLAPSLSGEMLQM